MTVGSPPSRTVTTELVVPRSMPTARAMGMASLPCAGVVLVRCQSRALTLLRGVRSTFLPSLTAGIRDRVPGVPTISPPPPPRAAHRSRATPAAHTWSATRGCGGGSRRAPSTGSAASPRDGAARGETLPVHPAPARRGRTPARPVHRRRRRGARATGTPRSSNLTASGRWVRLRRGVLHHRRRPRPRADASGRRIDVDCLAVLLALGRPTRGGQPRVGRPAVGPARRPSRPTGPVRLTDPDAVATRRRLPHDARTPPAGRGLAHPDRCA